MKYIAVIILFIFITDYIYLVLKAPTKPRNIGGYLGFCIRIAIYLWAFFYLQPNL